MMLDRSKLKSALEAGPDCLSAQQLEALAADVSPNQPHLLSCARCQAELAMLKAFSSDTPLEDEGAAVAWISSRLERNLDNIKSGRQSRPQQAETGWLASLRRLRSGQNLRWLIAVGAVLLVGATSLLIIRPTREPDLKADAGTVPSVYRSMEVLVIAPTGVVAEAPRTLQWKPVVGAAKYTASLMEVDQVPFWEGSTNDNSLTIPQDARSRIQPGKPILWRVTARDAQGRKIALSQLERFSVDRTTSN